MVSLSRLATVILVCFASLWFLPEVFRRAFQPERVSVSAYYSATEQKFLVRTDAFTVSRYHDESGRPYSADQFRRQLPFLYFSDLAKHGQFPEQVAGRAVTPEDARRSMQVMQLRPRDWNTVSINLHTLLESAPWGTKLNLPEDMFRVDPAGLTFLKTEDGHPNIEKSTRFTQAVTAAGVRWPLVALGGNPNPLKEFDDGYLLVDSTAQVFQLKMVHGAPVCRALGLTVPGRVRAIAVEEHSRREFLGIIVTDDTAFLVPPSGALIRLPLEGFNAEDGTVLLRTDPLNRTLATSALRTRPASATRLVATDEQYQPVRRFDLSLPEDYRHRLARLETVSSLLFPVSILQYVPEDARIQLRLRPAENLPLALLGGVIASILLWGGRHFLRQQVHPLDLLIPLLAGPVGTGALLLFGPITFRSTDSRRVFLSDPAA